MKPNLQVSFLTDEDGQGLKTKTKDIVGFTRVSGGVLVQFPDGTHKALWGREMLITGGAIVFQLWNYFMGFITITEVN
jgi:hypothetical protein